MDTLRDYKKRLVIDSATWPNIQPMKTIKRLTRFLSTFSKILCEKKLIIEPVSSEQLSKTIKEYFSHVWKLYYDMQIPMLLNNKKIL